MEKILYLVPDTNFFVQCREAKEIDWSNYKSYDRIELIITRPVQAELDSQKGKGSGRLAKRARKASSFIRDILLSDSDQYKIKSSPDLYISLRQDLRPNQDLASSLDFTQIDDQLVGVVSSLIKSSDNIDAYLLTHDTGPMASAKMVGVPFKAIPDDWLLKPESDEKDKTINSLLSELSKYKSQEPEFSFTAKQDNKPVQQFNLTNICFTELTPEEIHDLTTKLEERFPKAVDFGSPEKKEKPVVSTSLFSALYPEQVDIYTPASEESIRHYTNNRYPEWLKSCQDFFENLHHHLNKTAPPLEITIDLCNIGSRPALDSLITFSSKGSFSIYPIEAFNDDAKDATDNPELPSPPIAPQGSWKRTTKHQFPSLAGGMGDLNWYREPSFSPPTISPPFKRNEESFYWEPSRPQQPTKLIRLECKKWRHQIDEEPFTYVVSTEPTPGEIHGVLEVRIDCTNMTKSFEKRVNINIATEEKSALSYANKIIENLVADR